MFYVLNRLKKSKMGEIAKIERNRVKSRFQDRLCQNDALKQNSPPSSSCQAPIGCGNAQSRESLFNVFSEQIPKLTKYSPDTHKSLNSQITNWAPATTKAATTISILHKSSHGPVFTPSLSSVLTVAASILHKSGDDDLLNSSQLRPSS